VASLPSGRIFQDLGSTWTEQQKLVASDGAADDWFGFRLAASGDTLVIAAPYGDDNGNSSGAAYVFRYSGSSWNEIQKLVPSDGSDGDRFGRSVAIQGGTIMVGADQHGSGGPGALYVFRHDGANWPEEEKLLAPDAEAYDQFGRSVVISEDIAVAGLGEYFNGGAGAAYAYGYDGAAWFLKAKLLASDGAVRDAFGDTLDISDDYLLIGAHGDDDNGQTSHPGHRTAQIFISPYMNGVSGSSGPPALAGSAHRLGIKDQKGP
jgi:hypothetical protein